MSNIAHGPAQIGIQLACMLYGITFLQVCHVVCASACYLKRLNALV